MARSSANMEATVQMYRSDVRDLELDPQRIIDTVAALRDRIEERFPGSGLGKLSRRFYSIALRTAERLARVTRPNLLLRLLIGLLVLAFVGIFAGLILVAQFEPGVPDFFELIQTLEAGSNQLIFIGVALFFVFTFENRTKRRRALRYLRELRALAHIVDMHQLTKDPARVMRPRTDTPSSPARGLDQVGLAGYLDYCSEMLSLVSKIAALYAQSLDDHVVLAAVDEVESLTTGLSSKIWQKIMILEQPADEADRLKRSNV